MVFCCRQPRGTVTTTSSKVKDEVEVLTVMEVESSEVVMVSIEVTLVER